MLIYGMMLHSYFMFSIFFMMYNLIPTLEFNCKCHVKYLAPNV